jgi:succinate dehydrogenase / fumarate reductase membrane anchor subunit
MSWRAHGMRTWILQRLTAVYMLLYLIVFGIVILNQPLHDFSSWQGLFRMPVINIATILFFFSLLFHAWVGARDILIDYVAVTSIRLLLWLVITFGVIVMGIWISMILYAVVSI